MKSTPTTTPFSRLKERVQRSRARAEIPASTVPVRHTNLAAPAGWQLRVFVTYLSRYAHPSQRTEINRLQQEKTRLPRNTSRAALPNNDPQESISGVLIPEVDLRLRDSLPDPPSNIFPHSGHRTVRCSDSAWRNKIIESKAIGGVADGCYLHPAIAPSMQCV